MYGRRYFGGAYYGGAYFGGGRSGVPSGASASQIWAYVLSNGLPAGDTLVAIHAMLRDLYRIHGLEVSMPLAVGPTSRTAGPITQSIAEAVGVVTVERAP